MGIMSKILGNAGEIDAEELQLEYGVLLNDDEKISCGYKVVRDTFMFTNRRLLLVDVQGITGKKIQYLSVPYNKITAFSVETAGTLDLDAELKIWVTGIAIPVTKKFNKKVNIYEVQKVLSKHVVG